MSAIPTLGPDDVYVWFGADVLDSIRRDDPMLADTIELVTQRLAAVHGLVVDPMRVPCGSHCPTRK